MAAQFHSQKVAGGLTEARFNLDVDGELVPGALFLPADLAEPAPLLFIQHPGMGSKDDYFVREPSMLWARRGWICAGIDAPMHGDRASHDPLAMFRDRDRMPVVAAQFANEVHAAIDAIAAQFPVDQARVGYIGYSLGSMLGIPAVAKDGRFKAAAFCLVGEGGLVGPATGEGSVVPGLSNVAVRIVGKTNDELIPRERTEALYDALTGEKDIVWLPGGHYEIGADVIEAAGAWMASKLA